MTVKRAPGVLPLGNECYVFLEGNLLAVLPWDEGFAADATLPGHRASTARSALLLRDGLKLQVGLKPRTVVDRYLKALQAG